MNHTETYNFNLPQSTDSVDISKINDNFKTIDTFIVPKVNGTTIEEVLNVLSEISWHNEEQHDLGVKIQSQFGLMADIIEGDTVSVTIGDVVLVEESTLLSVEIDGMKLLYVGNLHLFSPDFSDTGENYCIFYSWYDQYGVGIIEGLSLDVSTFGNMVGREDIHVVVSKEVQDYDTLDGKLITNGSITDKKLHSDIKVAIVGKSTLIEGQPHEYSGGLNGKDDDTIAWHEVDPSSDDNAAFTVGDIVTAYVVDGYLFDPQAAVSYEDSDNRLAYVGNLHLYKDIFNDTGEDYCLVNDNGLFQAFYTNRESIVSQIGESYKDFACLKFSQEIKTIDGNYITDNTITENKLSKDVSNKFVGISYSLISNHEYKGYIDFNFDQSSHCEVSGEISTNLNLNKFDKFAFTLNLDESGAGGIDYTNPANTLEKLNVYNKNGVIYYYIGNLYYFDSSISTNNLPYLLIYNISNEKVKIYHYVSSESGSNRYVEFYDIPANIKYLDGNAISNNSITEDKLSFISIDDSDNLIFTIGNKTYTISPDS